MNSDAIMGSALTMRMAMAGLNAPETMGSMWFMMVWLRAEDPELWQRLCNHVQDDPFAVKILEAHDEGFDAK